MDGETIDLDELSKVGVCFDENAEFDTRDVLSDREVIDERAVVATATVAINRQGSKAQARE